MAAAENLQRVDQKVHEVQTRLGELLILKTAAYAHGEDPDTVELTAPGWVRYATQADHEYTGLNLTVAQKDDLIANQGAVERAGVENQHGWLARVKQIGSHLLDNFGVNHIRSGRTIG